MHIYLTTWETIVFILMILTVIYVAIDYFISERKAQRLENHKQPDMKTRFKTRQEFIATGYSNEIADLYSDVFGEPSTKDASHNIVTTTPHPYKWEGLKIRVTPQESEMVQKKAFALGYKWPNMKKTQHTDRPHIYLSPDKLITQSSTEDFFWGHEYTLLTPQQFMDGDLPDEFMENVKKYAKYYAGSDPYDSGKEKKPDAYIKNGYMHTVALNNYPAMYPLLEIQEGLLNYNLMSEEEFKKKHEPKLKFNQWLVTVDDKSVEIGCRAFPKEDVKLFMKYCNRVQKHNVSIDEFYVFLYTNKEALGL